MDTSRMRRGFGMVGLLALLAVGCWAGASEQPAIILNTQALPSISPQGLSLVQSSPGAWQTPTQIKPTNSPAVLKVTSTRPAAHSTPEATLLNSGRSATVGLLSPDWIEWTQAVAHAGESLTVCGPVASAHFASDSNGQPTFLNIGNAYPDPQRFTVVIWGRNRGNFDPLPEEAYLEKEICVTGEIELYQGMPEIEVESPAQILIR